MPQGPDDTFLEGMYQAMRKQAQNLAEHFKPGYGSKELDGDELETLWNRRAMPLEQEWELWRAVKEDGTPLHTREEIGRLVFPDREKLAKSGGRVEPAEWIRFSNSVAKRMAAKRAEQQATLMSPAPTIEGGY